MTRKQMGLGARHRPLAPAPAPPRSALPGDGLLRPFPHRPMSMLAGNHDSYSTVTMWRGAPSRFASVKAALSTRKAPGEQSWARELFELSKGAKGSASPVHAGHKPLSGSARGR